MLRNVVLRAAKHCIRLDSATLASDNKQQPGIKAVIFDMGGVILPKPFGDVINDIVDESLIPRKVFIDLLCEPNGLWARLERGEMMVEQFICHFQQIVNKKAGKAVNLEFMYHVMSNYNNLYCAQPDPECIDSLHCLRADGFKVALLTNNFRINETTTMMPLDRSLFDVIVESSMVGMRKPEPRIYQHCLSRLKVAPVSTIFLDDLGVNLKAAQKLGLRTIKVDNTKQALQDLEHEVGGSVQGYVPGTISVPERLQISYEHLTSYMNDTLNIVGEGQPLIRCFKHGQSNPTYSVKYADRTMVLRKKPSGKLLSSAHAVEREYRVMNAVKGGVPVPPLLGLCEHESILDTPFYLMDHVPGHVYTDYLLTNLPKSQRGLIYSRMCDVLCKIHSLDIDACQLSDYGKHGDYIKRNFGRWKKQYEASKTREIITMEKLGQWIPQHFPSTERITVVHGDFRLDNLIYDVHDHSVKAVLDWELSTLGDPISDLATCCLPYYLPTHFPICSGFGEINLKEIGIPTVEEFVSDYCKRMNLHGIANWNMYVVFVLYRMAAILQGVYKRSQDGQSSSPMAHIAGDLVLDLSQLAWNLASDSSRSVSGLPNEGVDLSGPYSGRNYSTKVGTTSNNLSHSTDTIQHIPPMPISVTSLSPRVQQLHSDIKSFIENHILPLEREIRERENGEDMWLPHSRSDELKAKAKNAGLWNLFLPLETDPDQKYGAGLTNLEYAFLSEEMGKCLPACEIFNCSPPDTGNMEVLVKYGTEDQKRKWLTPLLNGTIRSCFAMTEPKVASSDATNIESSIVRDGDEYIINGLKWWTSGALHPNLRLALFMGKTCTTGSLHKQQSIILVPMDAAGIKVIRPLSVFGFMDPPGGHGEVLFHDVRVPASNILLGEGRGFEIAQGRLGPGRVHHCMRLVGNAERALQLMVNRVQERMAFGKLLADQGTIQADIAKSRIEIEQGRLLVLKAAHLMDQQGNVVAAPHIAMMKAALPLMAQRVIDRAIQAHGGEGLNSDLPLAMLFSSARILRLADGPDEVHRRTVAKMEYRNKKPPSML